MKTLSTIQKSLWGSIGLLFIVALAAAAISTGLIAFFKKIETAFLAIILTACLLVSLSSLLTIRKHPTKQKRREAALIASNFVVVILSALLYPAGFLWGIPLFFVLILMMPTNTMMTRSASSTLLLNANTLFSIPMATTSNGLMYATHISADWGTLYLTFVSALVFAAFGFILATIALLIKRKKTYNMTQDNNRIKYTNDFSAMKKIFMIFTAMLALAVGVEAQTASDSVIISGKIILDCDEIGNPVPYSGAEIGIEGTDRILYVTTANTHGDFSFLMPKGEYTVFLWRNQQYEGHALLLEQENTHREVDAQANVELGEWVVGVENYFPFEFGPNSEMQRMKIDGVKVSVR